MRGVLFLTVAVVVGALAAPPALKEKGESKADPAEQPAQQSGEAPAENGNKTESLSQTVQDAAKTLPTLWKNQWAERVSQQKANFTAAAASLTKDVNAPAKAAVTEAVAQLQKLDTKIAANLSSLADEIVKNATVVIQKYTTLIQERSGQQASGATDESPIHELRKVEQETLSQSETKLREVNDAAHVQFQKAVDKLAEEAAKKSTDRQVGDQIRVAVNEVGTHLLANETQQQNEAIALLTTIQFPQMQNFTQNAETLLLQLLVAAKQAPGENKQGDAAAEVPTKQEDAPAKVSTKEGDAAAEVPTKQEDAPAKVPTKEGDAPAEVPTKQEDAPAKVSTKEGDAAAEVPTKQEDAPAKVPTKEGDAPAEVPTKQGDAPAEVPTKQGDAPEKVSNKQ